jgi:hypothetical protein
MTDRELFDAGYDIEFMHTYAAATAAQSERHAQELAAYALTVSNLRTRVEAHVPETIFVNIKKWAEDRQDPSPSEYWNKGYEAARAWVKMQLECAPQPADQPAAPDVHAQFWGLRSKILALPRYSFLLNKRGGVEKVADSCGEWIDVYAAAWLCEDVRVDAMIAAAPQPAQPELPDAEIRPLIPKDMDWKYVITEAGAAEFASAIIATHEAKRGAA